MAAGADIVVVQPTPAVEEEQLTEIGERRIDLATEARFEGRFDAAGESHLLQNGLQRRIELSVSAGTLVGVHWRGGPERGGQNRAANNRTVASPSVWRCSFIVRIFVLLIREASRVPLLTQRRSEAAKYSE